MGLSHDLRSPTECGVSECDREAMTMGKLWPTGGCRKMEKKKVAASSMLHEAKVAYYAFDVAARFLIWLFMPFLWLR